ncbi:MAG: Tm-1-like ATP-binding domain-containing protein [Caldilineaceae bacterium]
MADTKTILLIGTLDTKAHEYAYLRDLIQRRGHRTLVMDASVFDSTATARAAPLMPDIDAAQVAQAGGSDLVALREQGDRNQALVIMTQGCVALARQLFAEGRFDAVLGLGGSGGTALATAVMRELPIGVPKVMVSTIASGDVGPYVGAVDITMLHSVVDIAGLNRISRRVLMNAVGAVCGMVEQQAMTTDQAADRPLITATMFGVTTPCVTHLRERLEGAGYEVLVFHATGNGGRAMEALIAGGLVAGVADVTTTEWADELVGGMLGAGPHRLEAAARQGVPQVVSCGALDMVNFLGPFESIPARFKDRHFHIHNANVTLMRTTPAECAELGHIIAEKLNRSTGPTTLLVPLKGVSMLDSKGASFYDPEADAALFDALRRHVRTPPVDLIELDLHINDPEFADALADHLLTALAQVQINNT